ncbi:eukaryotic translation initiation factor 4G [Citrus clementina]|uniref:eukaryotic translation initiation factor 4G n=1 Tax=Citrus clementina TaxID=85681 RepID=UPI000CED6EE3|nr:eukaryotic translation initiation factor 4G [Citrus x clementina]
MSFNQSRSDRSETQYRKSGRSAGSNQQRTSSGSYGKGAGGGPAPSPSVHSSSSLPSSNRSFKKSHNAQGGQSRVNVPAVNSSDSTNNASAHRNVQNGAHLQPQLHGASDAPVGANSSKQVDSSTPQRSTRAVPKAPTSQSASMSSDSTASATQAKAPGDVSKAFHFQFGSIGMQIPARTSSAPPNLDEQKRDQALHDAYRSVPNIPMPSVPKQQQPRKEAGVTDQSNTVEVHQVPKVKKDPQVSLPPMASPAQKPSVLPIPMTSMQMPFHQPQVSVQFGGHNPQVQSQNVTATSLPMPMPIPLPMGNAPQVQQHMFVPGLQPHPMPQGLMHQGQGMGFTTQMGPPQLPPQLGNMGMGMTPQYPQQQGGKFGSGPRKTIVKITHPDTHKEVRLDERSDTYSDGGVSGPRSQSQPIPSFASAHPINYYPNSYGASSIYYPAPGSLPLTSSQITPNSQATRFNYPVGQGPQNVSFMNPNLNSLPVSKTGTPMPGIAEPTNFEQSRDAHISSAPLGTVQVTVKPASGSVGEKSADSSSSDISPAVGKVATPKPSRPSGEATTSHHQGDPETSPEKSSQKMKSSSELLVSNSLAGAIKQSVAVSLPVSTESLASNSLPTSSFEESVPVANVEGRRRESLSRSSSIKDNQKKPGKKGQIQTQQQVGGQSTSTSSLGWRTAETGIQSNSGVSETKEAKTTSELSSAIDASTSDISEAKDESTKQSVTSVLAEISGAGNAANVLDTDCDAKKKLGEFPPQESLGTEARGGETLADCFKQDIIPSEIASQSATSKSIELVSQTDQESVLKATAVCNEVPILGTTEEVLGESARASTEAHRVADNMDASSSGIADSTNVECSHGNKTSTVDALSSKSVIQQHPAPVSATEFLETIPKTEGEVLDNSGAGSVLLPVSGSKDMPVVELNRSKSSITRGKKKRREILLKADAAGTTSDLYMAYKGPEEKEAAMPLESAQDTSTIANSKQVAADTVHVHAVASEKSVHSKAEPDDWEDAADMSTPKLEPLDEDGNGNLGKKYSRDFLLKFAEQCTDLPEGFEIAADIAEALMSGNINISHLVDRDSYPSPGRATDRQSGGPRVDRRGSVMVDDDRWGRLPGPSLGRDLRLDVGYGANAGFRPGQGGNYGVLRNPRPQIPMQYPGGILPGPMQPMGSQGGMQRNSPDADRWQRIANFQQKGLIPSPQTPLQMMHKADRKYEVGKVQDGEEAKQRQLKAILNKLTPQNFEKLFEQVKAVNIDNAVTLTGVISQIFDKALMEPTFCEMYANFCYFLAGELPDFSEDNEKITFKRLLLNKCQEEFERGEREQEEANKADKEGEIKQTEEEREEKRIKARRRMLGNIRLIGELYKKKMLTERIMHECIKKLLGQYENPDEEDVEALCKLMSTIGEMIDHPKAKEHMDAYFDRMEKFSNNMKLSSRVRFMLKDSIELRKNKWQQRRKVEGPKKIEEVHRDAAQERQAQASRLARGPSMNSSSRRAPMDFGPRGLSSPTTQMGSFRGLPTQNRGYGGQDVRFEDRQSYEARTLSVPLPQRPIGDESITLGPQGGLARGMSIRGPPAMSSTPLPDISPGAGEPRRIPAGLNGFSSLSERPAYGSREDIIPRYHPDRFAAPPAFDQLNAQERNINYGNRDLRAAERSFDRPLATSPTQGQVPSITQNVPSEKVWSEEYLREKSIAAIKEFYSARDEKEVAWCIKDLNSPGFHPSMVSLWVTDSFERKDMERDLLAKLLVNLAKSREGMLSQGQLIKGFESVLTTLEDAVNDAPRAAEFLGRIFAKVVEENVIPLREIGRLLREGGEEPGRLQEIGLAGDVLGSTLEIIKSDKGESVLHEVRMSSNLRLEDFRPPEPNRSRILEKFI